jgi:hypothetical protein
VRSPVVDPRQVAMRRCVDCRTVECVDAITWARHGARCARCWADHVDYVRRVLHRAN